MSEAKTNWVEVAKDTACLFGLGVVNAIEASGGVFSGTAKAVFFIVSGLFALLFIVRLAGWVFFPAAANQALADSDAARKARKP